MATGELLLRFLKLFLRVLCEVLDWHSQYCNFLH